jgi:hypothetical protein
MDLNHFDYDIRYIPGAKNVVADRLSRRADHNTRQAALLVTEITDAGQMSEDHAQQEDHEQQDHVQQDHVQQDHVQQDHVQQNHVVTGRIGTSRAVRNREYQLDETRLGKEQIVNLSITYCKTIVN